MANQINPKGISVGGGSNGAPYREKERALPPSNSKPDMGAAVGGLERGKRGARDESSTSRNLTVKQKSSSSALKTRASGGLKKR